MSQSNCSSASQTSIKCLDPALASLQENSMGAMDHQAQYALINSQNRENYNADTNNAHPEENCQLERMVLDNAEELKKTQEAFKAEIRMLHLQIQGLQVKGLGISLDVSHGAEYATMSPKNSSSVLSKEAIAKDCLRIAADNDKIAASLREQAEALLVHQVQHAKQTERSMTGSGDGLVSYCCNTRFDSLIEIAHHFHEAHSDTTWPMPACDTDPESSSSQGRSDTRASFGSIKNEDAKSASLELHGQQQQTMDRSTSQEYQSLTAWIPYGVRSMTENTFEVPEHVATFSYDFLTDELGGKEVCSGFFYDHSNKVLPSKAYWILEPDFEPYLPQSLGRNGAKISAFFNESDDAPFPENYMDCPVFIRDAKRKQYRYFGHYSQTRCSDKISYDQLMDKNIIPDSVLRHWATVLSSNIRPEWLSQNLLKHFWPKPAYDGEIQFAAKSPHISTTAVGSECIMPKVPNDFADYAAVLQELTEEARVRVMLLTEQNIYDSFSNADADAEPGLRLWWEYLQCVRYDEKFEKFLVKLRDNPSLRRYASSSSHSTASLPSPPRSARDAFNHRAINETTRINVAVENEPGRDDSVRVEPVAPVPSNGEEIPASSSSDDSLQRVGDLEAAKQFNASATKAQSRRGKAIPPHLRAKP